MAKEDFVIQNGELIDYRGCDCEIVVPHGVHTIGGDAFLDHDNVTKVVMPDGVKHIANGAFSFCSHLTYVYIPRTVESIGHDAFCGCESLDTIVVDENNAVFAVKNGALFSKGGEKLIAVPKNVQGVWVIPDTVELIGQYAFEYCVGLTSVVIPSTVTEIGDVAFYACQNLEKVVLPPSVTEIGDDAFDWCPKLQVIEIPASVTWMGDNLFDKSKNLTIKAPVGSEAQRYAKKYKIKFEELGALT